MNSATAVHIVPNSYTDVYRSLGGCPERALKLYRQKGFICMYNGSGPFKFLPADLRNNKSGREFGIVYTSSLGNFQFGQQRDFISLLIDSCDIRNVSRRVKLFICNFIRTRPREPIPALYYLVCTAHPRKCIFLAGGCGQDKVGPNFSLIHYVHTLQRSFSNYLLLKYYFCRRYEAKKKVVNYVSIRIAKTNKYSFKY